MMIDQGELLSGTSMLFMKEFMDIAAKETHVEGNFLFHEGDPATHFYTLISGDVRLSIRGKVQRVYNVTKAGEAFGWSSLLDRDAYSASAQCVRTTVLLKIDRENLRKLLDNHPKCGHTFYKNLAKTLGNRLLTSYQIIADVSA